MSETLLKTHTINPSQSISDYLMEMFPIHDPDYIIISSSLRQKDMLYRQFLEKSDSAPIIYTLDALVRSSLPERDYKANEGLDKWIFKQALSGHNAPMPILDRAYQLLRQLFRVSSTIPKLPYRLTEVFHQFFALSRSLSYHNTLDTQSLSVEMIQKFGLIEAIGKHIIFVGFFNESLHQKQVMNALENESKSVHKILCTPQTTPSIFLNTPSSAIQEFEDIVQEIGRQITENGVPLQTISIVLPDLHGKRQLAEDTLKKYGIPYRVSIGDALTETALGHFSFSLLTLLANNLEKQALIHFLRAPFVRLKEASLWPDFVESIAKKYRVDQGLEEWKYAWISACQNAEKRCTLGESETLVEDTQQLESLRRHWIFLEPLLTQLNDCQKSRTAEAFIEKLQGIMSLFLHPSILGHQLEEINKIFDEFKHFYPLLEGKFELKTAIQALFLLLENCTLPSQQSDENGLYLLGKKEAYMIQSNVQFIVSCTEAHWPGQLLDSPLITNRTTLPFPSEEAAYEEEKTLFSILLAQAQKTFVSVPATEEDLPTLASHFLLEVPTNTWHPPTGTISSKESLFAQIGQSLDTLSKKEIQRYLESYSQLTLETIARYQNKKASGELMGAAPLQSTFSASRLEAFQRCPYHYFLHHVLKLPEPTSDEDIPPYVWGEFLHAIFFESKYNLSALPMIAKKHFKDKRHLSFEWEIYDTLFFGDHENEGLLDAIKRVEDTSDFQLSPLEFEHRFSVELEDGERSLTLTGQIDLILINPDTQSLVILDYKTGSKIPTMAELSRFESLQLPLYMIASETLYPEKETVGGIIYQLKSPQKTGKHVLIATDTAKKDIFNLSRKRPIAPSSAFFLNFKEHIFQLSNLINQGNFSVPNTSDVLAPFEKNRPSFCRFCAYKQVCDEPRRFSA